MSVITKNTIQPASGQALTIKDEGGTASITVQTDGDLTLAENAYLGSGKGIYFDGQTTSSNFLDDYEEGTFSTTISGAADVTVNDTGRTHYYTKIGNLVYCKLYFNITGASSGAPRFEFTVPFSMTTHQTNINGFGYPYALQWWGIDLSGNNFSIRSTTTSASAHDLVVNVVYSTS